MTQSPWPLKFEMGPFWICDRFVRSGETRGWMLGFFSYQFPLLLRFLLGDRKLGDGVIVSRQHLCVCMYVCMDACMYVCVYVHINMHEYMYVYLCVHIYIAYTHAHTHTNTRTRTHTHTHTYTHIHMRAKHLRGHWEWRECQRRCQMPATNSQKSVP